ncbi:MAG: hypothetical protein H7257_15150 [Taibaiella sp.]|nr:hypothetical protein [Taibaiella sp.]
MPLGITAMGKWRSFTISKAAAEYILKYVGEHQWGARFFKLSQTPDEIISQPILYNSPFKDDMINDHLLYVDWSKGGQVLPYLR